MPIARHKEKTFLRRKAQETKGQRGLLHNSWWVVLFLVLCAVVYSQAMQKKKEVIATLLKQRDQLLSDKEISLAQLEDLTLQINSQSDPAWIQLLLMKGLGLVPEGQLKVYFQGEEATGNSRLGSIIR